MAELPASTWAGAWVLTGPTAAGKTALALAMAGHVPLEIVSLDSMAVYRGLDIGTAKPTAAQRAAVPHHLLDVVEVEEPFSLGQYLTLAAQVVPAIRARGAQPLFVGGTPLYLRALLRGVDPGPPADPAVRAALRVQARQQGAAALWDELARVDPRTAARLHPQDQRRVVRALEVFRLTGRPLSLMQQHAAPRPLAERPRVWCLEWPREVLAARIDRRVEQMYQQGLVEELAGLRASGRELGPTARAAVGYAEAAEVLAGRLSVAQARELTARRTRQLAKRQRTWFRSLEECEPLLGAEQEDPAALAQEWRQALR